MEKLITLKRNVTDVVNRFELVYNIIKDKIIFEKIDIKNGTIYYDITCKIEHSEEIIKQFELKHIGYSEIQKSNEFAVITFCEDIF